jgi:hypothetical protein
MEPKGHVVDGNFCDVSSAWQAKHFYHAGQSFIPCVHVIQAVLPVQAHAMWVFRISQDTQTLCIDQH